MSGSAYSAYCKPYFKQFIVINTTDSYLLISTCMENIQDTPRGGGLVWVEKKRKKRVRARVKVFPQEIINKK